MVDRHDQRLGPSGVNAIARRPVSLSSRLRMLLLLLAVHAQHPDGGACTRAPAVAAAVDSGWRAYRQRALEGAGAPVAAAAAARPGAAGRPAAGRRGGGGPGAGPPARKRGPAARSAR